MQTDIRTHTYMHTHIRTHTHMQTDVRTHIHTYTRTHAHTYIPTHARTPIHDGKVSRNKFSHKVHYSMRSHESYATMAVRRAVWLAGLMILQSLRCV